MNNRKYCINCGKSIPANAKFCSYCGASQDGTNMTNTSVNNSSPSQADKDEHFIDLYTRAYDQAKAHHESPIAYDTGEWMGYHEGKLYYKLKNFLAKHGISLGKLIIGIIIAVFILSLLAPLL